MVGLLDIQTFFELLGRPYPADRKGVIERLIKQGLIDKTAEGYSIRRMGALLLAKRLDEFPLDISAKAPRIVAYSGNSKINTRHDHIENKGYAAGFQWLLQLVMAQLPQREEIKDALRRKIILAPEIAVRELIANALIHQDFCMTGMRVMIEIYDDRVEISNPGEPPVPVERFIDGGGARNKRLAAMMRRFSICEERGGGIDKVIAAAEESGLQAPEFRAESRRTKVILYGAKPLDEMDRNARVRACYQHCVLQYVLGRRMTSQTLGERFKLSARRRAVVSKVIDHALEANVIKPDAGAGAGASEKYDCYVPVWG
ncbi:MAG: MloB [Gammaproteobacteria bacterium AqS3]|nr:MloB [Gammaproteobacteria bacterium AqS3]